MTITIRDHLTQQKLEQAVRETVGGEHWIGTEQQVEGGRKYRWDMVIRSESGGLAAIEFDGDVHYRDSLRIKTDRAKDSLATSARIQVIRIPYWVQLTSLTAAYYFGWDIEIVQDFPHGFITTKLFPASFCEMGVERFQQELAALPYPVRAAVISSLKDRAGEHGIEYVLPAGLRHLLE